MTWATLVVRLAGVACVAPRGDLLTYLLTWNVVELDTLYAQ